MNRKKWRMAALALVLVLVSGVPGCSRKKGNEVETIQASGALRVAIVETGSQYTHQEGSSVAGQEPDLAEYIAQALGVKAEYQVCTREEALDKLTKGEADIALGCINGSSVLTSDYLLSTPYGKGYFYAVTKTGDYALTLGAFRNSALGVEKSLDEETRGKLYGAEGIRVADYSDSETAVKAIKEDSIRAYICYEEKAKALLSDPGLQVQNITDLAPEEFVIVAPKSSQTLVSGMNILIQQFLDAE